MTRQMRLRLTSEVCTAAEITSGRRRPEPDKATLVNMRKEVRLGWRTVSDVLVRQGQPELAASVRRLVDNMGTPVTEKEQMTADLTQHIQQTRHCHMDREALSPRTLCRYRRFDVGPR